MPLPPKFCTGQSYTHCEAAKHKCTREGAEERENSPQILSLLLVQPHTQVNPSGANQHQPSTGIS